MAVSWDSETESYDECSSTCSDSSFDEEDVNRRIKPYWPKYRSLFEGRGFQLDTVRDAREYYRRVEEKSAAQFLFHDSISSVLCSEEGSSNDDELCPDAGLPDNLFRGVASASGKKFVVKAVHYLSREYQVVKMLSSPPLRDNPMNHTIPILDLFECPCPLDPTAFIVMEEWSSQLIPESGGPCCLKVFFEAIRQCIEHAAFMHQNRIVHLDISLRNLVTDFKGHYAYIDFELSRYYQDVPNPRIFGHEATEVPPECDSGKCCDPFKVDVWALGVLLLRTCKVMEFDIPELVEFTAPMLNLVPEKRPLLQDVLGSFDAMVSKVYQRIPSRCGQDTN